MLFCLPNVGVKKHIGLAKSWRENVAAMCFGKIFMSSKMGREKTFMSSELGREKTFRSAKMGREKSDVF